MAGSTTNLSLIKPTYSEDADIADINTNMDTLDSKIGPVGGTSLQAQVSKILPVISGTTNNSGYAISAGEYFEANGALYKASASIPPGNAWSSSATAQSDHGAVNALNTAINNGVLGTQSFSSLSTFKTFLANMTTGKSVNIITSSEVSTAICGSSYICSGVATKIESDFVDINWARGESAAGSSRYKISTQTFSVNDLNSNFKNGNWTPVFTRDTATNLYASWIAIGNMLFITAQWTNAHGSGGASIIDANSLPSVPGKALAYGIHGTWRSNSTDVAGEIGQYGETSNVRFSKGGVGVELPNEQISFSAFGFLKNA